MGTFQSRYQYSRNHNRRNTIDNRRASINADSSKFSTHPRRRKRFSLPTSSAQYVPVASPCDLNRSTSSSSKPKKIRFKHSKRNLSGTFHLDDVDFIDYEVPELPEFSDTKSHDSEWSHCEKNSLININQASEEHLMTVSGIDRKTAHSIVNYRAKIGGRFRIVEDLALVNGIGAHKLMRMRSELYCGGSTAVTPSATWDRLSSCAPSSIYSFNKCNIELDQIEPIDLNTCNMFDLMKIPIINQSLAERIITKRLKVGAYNKIDDLKHIHGINSALVCELVPYFFISDDLKTISLPRENRLSRAKSWLRNSMSAELNHSQRYAVTVDGGGGSGVRGRSVTSSLKYHLFKDGHYRTTSTDGSCNSDISGIEGPLCQRSIRTTNSLHHYRRPSRVSVSNRKCCKTEKKVKVATWDLDHCTNDKIANPGVREVICMTLLENGFGIIAVQDVYNEAVLNKICDELNNPTIMNVCTVGYKSLWQSVSSHCMANQNNESMGFIFDTSSNIHLLDTVLIDSCFIATFKIGGVTLSVVNCSDMSSRGEAFSRVNLTLDTTDTQAILVVDNSAPSLENGGDVCGYSLKTSTTDENIPRGVRTNSSIWMNKKALTYFNDRIGYVTSGLSNPWIPKGWSWGGLATKYAPLWAEFGTTDESDSNSISR